jgi:2-methylcitrate dehydratase PrpD
MKHSLDASISSLAKAQSSTGSIKHKMAFTSETSVAQVAAVEDGETKNEEQRELPRGSRGRNRKWGNEKGEVRNSTRDSGTRNKRRDVGRAEWGYVHYL